MSRNFVPVATNLYKVREQKDAAGDFFRAVRAKVAQYQGFWIVTPEGEVLAAHHDVKNQKNWNEEVLTAVDAALKRAGPLKAREAQPHQLLADRGKGELPDGGANLAVTVRLIFNGRPEGHGVFDNIVLTKEQWKEFAPPKTEVGATWQLSRSTASQFSRCLSGISDQSNMPKPDEVTDVKLTGHVDTVQRGVAVVTYQGQIAATHKHPFEKGKTNSAQAQFRGIATYDVKTQKLRTLLLMVEGTYRTFQPYDGELHAISAAVEWRE